jgi:hypothetical protein
VWVRGVTYAGTSVRACSGLADHKILAGSL